MTGLGSWMSSMTVCSLPRYCRVTLRPKMVVILWGLTDGAVGIQQRLAELVQRGATMEDQVVAVLHLSEKQAVLAPRLSALLVGEERREGRQPLVGTGQQVSAGQGVGQLLQALGILTIQEGIGTLLKSD